MSVTVESDLPRRLLEPWLQEKKNLDWLLNAFLQCELPLREWTHRAHLGVSAVLVERRGRENALSILRAAISNYNEATGGANTESSGYHETLTVFWVDRVTELLGRLPAGWDELTRVRVVVEAYGMIRRLDRAFYSYDVAASKEARRTWVEPDR